jgi:hypothetical protein
MRKQVIFLALIGQVFFSASAQNNDKAIVGLWQVMEVQAGDSYPTPVARWMEFKADGTQRSGNGWQQHSVGTYEYSAASHNLSIVNTNGYEDTNPPFSVSIEGSNMEWERQEEGSAVRVILKRIDELPAAPADQLMGVWKLNDVIVNGQSRIKEFDPDKNRYLFLRWDKQFRVRNTPEGNQAGIYYVSAHQQELQLISKEKREEWSFEIKKQQLLLKRLEKTKEITQVYTRIHHFPK